MKGKPVKDVAASVRQRLLNLAQQRGEDFGFVLSRYAVERLLYRLGRSRQAGGFVLKGAQIFALWLPVQAADQAVLAADRGLGVG